MEEKIKNFLSSRKGLEYLLMKYPTLSLVDAIKEFEITYYKQASETF